MPEHGPRFCSLAAFVDHLELNLFRIRIPDVDLPPMGPIAGHFFVARVGPRFVPLPFIKNKFPRKLDF